MVRIASGMTFDAVRPEFVEEAREVWVERVVPALDELDELVEERRLRRQFSAHAGAALPGAIGGLVTGVVTGETIFAGGVGVTAAVAGTSLAIVEGRRRVGAEIKRRPFFFLYRTEELLSARTA